jgi:hypothetical protein
MSRLMVEFVFRVDVDTGGDGRRAMMIARRANCLIQSAPCAIRPSITLHLTALHLHIVCPHACYPQPSCSDILIRLVKVMMDIGRRGQNLLTLRLPIRFPQVHTTHHRTDHHTTSLLYTGDRIIRGLASTLVAKYCGLKEGDAVLRPAMQPLHGG